uniref:Phospholipase B-like n=1 Tax=Polytomella parva TaxID=51329 RepID=A0A7S0YAD9_9CHLO|mmetsp:Transcript_13095/g.23266  ORF Transcript_13095/g.23266 Transcript_13095/m.23266 type:complete len:537 (+) Transcript_13095:252-1862(+)
MNSNVTAASGSFSFPSNQSSLMGQLRIQTSPLYSNIIQAQAAGYLEGFLTAELIFDHYMNLCDYYSKSFINSFDLGRWLSKNKEWIRSQITSCKSDEQAPPPFQSKSSPPFPYSQTDEPCTFWGALEIVLAQFDGLIAGYNAYVRTKGSSTDLEILQEFDFLLMNSIGDLSSISKLMDPGTNSDGLWSNSSAADIRRLISRGGHCSALIKVTPDLEDILIGHSTWGAYATMLRIYKHYDFALQGALNGHSSFASYPGLIGSNDDWYVLGSGLVVTSTSHDLHNASLVDEIEINAALSWHRVLAANLLAGSGSQWTFWASFQNSGSNPGQYAVVDLKRFQPKQQLGPGLLTVLEIAPGIQISEDVTTQLVTGYWPSYNVPYFKEMYDSLGFKQLFRIQSDRGVDFEAVALGLSYELSPRAKLFRRDAVKILNLDGMKSVIRSNGWPVDSFSAASPWDAICGRGDLDPLAPDVFGCYDGKVTNYKLAMARVSYATSAPPVVGNMPFSWESCTSDLCRFTLHRAQPNNFDGAAWQLQQP